MLEHILIYQRQANGKKVVRKVVGNVAQSNTKFRPHKFSKYQNPVQGVYIRKSKRTIPGGYMREAGKKKLETYRLKTRVYARRQKP